jgi:ribosomal-protein-alanine N-acetyltransferase
MGKNAAKHILINHANIAMNISGKKTLPTIRDIRQEDIPSVAAIEAVTSFQPWSAEDLAVHIAKQGAINAAAILDTSDIAGFVCCQCAADEMEVHKLAVDRRLRRRGIGEKLLTYAIGRAQSAGILSVHLEVASQNDAAAGLYAKLGFVETYRRKGYYAAGRDDAIVMSLKIISPNEP